MDLELQTPEEFSAFPYQPPYSIQVDLMRHLYTSLEKRSVTIVESPTGTGKTLTLLASSLTWLMDERERARKGQMKEVAGADIEAKDWVVEQTLARIRREMEADEREYEEKLSEARKREQQLRRKAAGRLNKKPRYSNTPSASTSKKEIEEDDDDDIFLPEDDVHTDDGEHISAELRDLMDKVHRIQRSKCLNTEDEEMPCTKIYYASRTHSQLTQVLPELGKLKFKLPVSVTDHHGSQSFSLPRKRSIGDGDNDDNEGRKQFRAVSLGSRKQLCINDNLRAKSRDLDEACRELLGEKKGRRCQHLPQPGEEIAMIDFRDQILASPKDIEDLAEAGRLANTCPYFASRKAISQAELVTLPYNLLLQKSAREALGIDLKDQIVIIDEAHNLIPTLLSLSTVKLSYSALALSLQQVCSYVQRFRNRLSSINMLHLKRLVVFLDALKKAVTDWKTERLAAVGSKAQTDKAEVMTLVDFMAKLGKKASSINLLEIEGYLKKSKIARKIAGYSDKQAEKEADAASVRKMKRGTLPPLHTVEDFMISLSHPNDDGRVTFTLVEIPGQEGTVELKYQLLNPAPNFMEVVEEARSVVLAGGTMSPISDVINQLFYRVPLERITSFSCGHVIPEENLQTMVVAKGPKGTDLDFRAGKWQGDPAVISDLGQMLYNYACVVPAGMIVFFPSYSFLNTAKDIWAKNKTLDRFGTKKKVFFEPQESTDVDAVLREYAAAVHASPQTGNAGGSALLFAVIGAKLSEGLNFADDLARAVVIVGLPFPNLGSPELRERMKYVKTLEEKSGRLREVGKKDAAGELYENMCMNAVNQSIGRAIRHRNDWASLLLLDRRYSTPSIRSKLPEWIGKKLVVNEAFGQTVKDLAAFNAQRRKQSLSS